MLVAEACAMKFHCPNCEAKYRIADEKMMSRATPRMKCRKCGFMIDIRASAASAEDDDDDGSAVTVASLRPEGPDAHVAPIPPLPVPPPVPGGGLLGQELDTAKLTSAVAVSAGTFGGVPPMNLGLAAVAPVQAAPAPAAPLPPVVSAGLAAHEKTPDSAMPFSRGFMELQEAAGLKKSNSIPALGWVLVAVAYGLGVATGAIVFQTQGAAEATPPPAASVAPGPVEQDRDPEPVSELAALSGHAPVASAEPASAQAKTGVSTASRPVTGSAPSPTGRGLLTGLQTGQQTGPTAGPGAGEGASGGGGQLSSADIQKTVSSQQPGVRRGCWERALNSRDMSAPSSARVTVSVTVAPSGQVTRVSSGGDPPGYPGLATCIENRVRTWSFPRSGEQTTVNVPFVFTAQ